MTLKPTTYWTHVLHLSNEAIQERLSIIEGQYYSEKVARPIRLMLEYDLERRPAPMELKALLDS